ncbi:hypothetical protein [Enterococcus faecalis]|uniref:hypothetical protein n=1 Tax=Enterococcus TaxID=1350 RepID=UPI00070A8813|nr:hypothetical protein [Enterococcus faecalis]KXF70030.1 hypothetical protein AQ486_10685 [Enterococcus faecalis]KXF74532.1 hypothetical protein AQ487_00025 [Enterococcus faecalis]MBC2812189.1 hypothetical protein [Enterococcus faecalis]MBC2817120.1 hypothetical protein [Enterococcus faecalis]MBC2821277.1 hypothetical protein [Enterococcus faecalis]
MKNNLSKKSGNRYFVYILILFSLLAIGIVFLMLGHNEVVQSTDLSNGDVGFGYSAAGAISIFLSVVTGAVISSVQLFNQLIKRRKVKKLS